MKRTKEKPSSSSSENAIDLISVVKSVNNFSSEDLSKLLKDSRNLTIPFTNGKGLPDKVDLEKFASFLPKHLLAFLIQMKKDESVFTYVLSGIRLLHSLCDLAPEHSKLEQILLDDVKISEQIIDLVFYLLIVLNGSGKEVRDTGRMPFLHSALVACSLYLFNSCISSQLPELAYVLVSHPKVDIFMDTAFGAVHMTVRFLHRSMHAEVGTKSAEDAEAAVSFLCLQLEASLQFLQFLCQQKPFCEKLIKNKELCEKGGVLYLARSILKLNAAPHLVECTKILASISRMKSKILSILLNLCNAESVSYLEEIASHPTILDLAKSVSSEVFDLMKNGLSKNPEHLNANTERAHPTGHLLLNSMRMADVFSDDSNFRSDIILNYSEFLSAVFSLTHEEFSSMWLSSDVPVKEEDATVEYDSFSMAGCVLSQNLTKTEFSLVPVNMTPESYLQQRTSMLIKVVSNLHCYLSEHCEAEEENAFLNKFLDCMQLDPSNSLPGFSFTSGPDKKMAVWRNIRSLVSHADSRLSPLLAQEDRTFLREFADDFRLLINPGEVEETQDQEGKTVGGCPSSLPRRDPLNPNSQNGNLKEEMSENYALKGDDVVNIESSGSDLSSTRAKNSLDQIDNGDSQIKDNAASEEQQQRKRKRTVMNDTQVRMMERALLDDPDMQRNTASVQSMADKLSCHGTEVTSSQLRNWLNNRKARLSRASKEALAILEAESLGNQGGPTQGHDSPGRDTATDTRDDPKDDANEDPYVFTDSVAELVRWKRDQVVRLVDEHGTEIGTGRVHQVEGKWCGMSLDDSGKCVVDIVGLKADRWMKVPYPSEASGASFEEAEKRFGVIRVIWDSNKLFLLRPK